MTLATVLTLKQKDYSFNSKLKKIHLIVQLVWKTNGCSMLFSKETKIGMLTWISVSILV